MTCRAMGSKPTSHHLDSAMRRRPRSQQPVANRPRTARTGCPASHPPVGRTTPGMPRSSLSRSRPGQRGSARSHAQDHPTACAATSSLLRSLASPARPCTDCPIGNVTPPSSGWPRAYRATVADCVGLFDRSLSSKRLRPCRARRTSSGPALVLFVALVGGRGDDRRAVEASGRSSAQLHRRRCTREARSGARRARCFGSTRACHLGSEQPVHLRVNIADQISVSRHPDRSIGCESGRPVGGARRSSERRLSQALGVIALCFRASRGVDMSPP